MYLLCEFDTGIAASDLDSRNLVDLERDSDERGGAFGGQAATHEIRADPVPDFSDVLALAGV